MSVGQEGFEDGQYHEAVVDRIGFPVSTEAPEVLADRFGVIPAVGSAGFVDIAVDAGRGSPYERPRPVHPLAGEVGPDPSGDVVGRPVVRELAERIEDPGRGIGGTEGNRLEYVSLRAEVGEEGRPGYPGSFGDVLYRRLSVAARQELGLGHFQQQVPGAKRLGPGQGVPDEGVDPGRVFYLSPVW